MKQIRTILLLLLMLFSWVEILYAENEETIREMQQDSKTLQKEKSILDFKWSTFQIWGETLADFLIELNEQDQKSLSEIIEVFQSENEKLERNIDKKINRGSNIENKYADLIELKKNFYKDLLPFIASDKRDHFLSYINKDVTLNEKSRRVSVEIKKIELAKKNRVEELKEQAVNNYSSIEENIERKAKISIENFIHKESFSNLSLNSQFEVFQTIKGKLNSKIDNSYNLPRLQEDLLKIVVWVVEEYIIVWQEKQKNISE